VEGRYVEGRFVGRTFYSEGRFVEGLFVVVPKIHHFQASARCPFFSIAIARSASAAALLRQPGLEVTTTSVPSLASAFAKQAEWLDPITINLEHILTSHHSSTAGGKVGTHRNCKLFGQLFNQRSNHQILHELVSLDDTFGKL
jgi:hypothetical protein